MRVTSLKIEVTSKDLLEFADALVERAAAKARAEIERQSDVEYIPKKEAIDLLGVCDATLWHWARSGYLVPSSSVGGSSTVVPTSSGS